ncbi:hypothetical protein CTA2_2920 [Colletotrichum tanaceti]|uniref:Aminoglycoside phosphotransferase domain-containing protein n=1 Tax=Colletotrichum tanaceti TaxID=1306861 RepID=A0A4U6XG03_9PEZI|nr:hypothetical protein CTA2_2920 [Colletotrichum tanaceti]TKW52907.1 hypothetical protein CTA1_12056 [Colletotrichum tanaceti]
MPGEKRNLFPDGETLRTIFSGVDIKPTDCKIISYTFDTCTFSIHPKTAAIPGHPKDLLIRLEVSGRRLDQVAAFQKLAHDHLLDLVPPVVSGGTTTTADGTQVDYAVSEYCTGAIPLEDVWGTLDQENQMRLMDSVVCAVEKVQAINISSSIQNLGPQSNDALVGGPQLGYFPNIGQLLDGILRASDLERRNCTLSEVDGGIVLKSDFEDIGQAELTRADLDDLKGHVVFCHNDLEPRNILVRRVTESNSPCYDLAAIVDWEMAGFFPFAYEYGIKDNVLGSSNLSFSWYSLFKERTSHLLPQNACHERFIRALGVIDESKRNGMARNVGVQFQKKWVAAHCVEKSPDVRRGWVLKAGAKAPGHFTKEDNDTFLQQVQEELGLI